MNAKHPIDELFARSLRDAEAQPPAAVWAGIARERDRAAALRRARRSRGLAGLALLLLGAAVAYLLLQDSTPVSYPGIGAGQMAHTHPAQEQLPASPSVDGGPGPYPVQAPDTRANASDAKDALGPQSTTSALSGASSPEAGSTTAGDPHNPLPHDQQVARTDVPTVTKASDLIPEAAEQVVSSTRISKPDIVDDSATSSTTSGITSEAAPPRHAAGELLVATARPTLVLSQPLVAPVILPGRSKEAYVFRKGHNWLGLQLELASSTGQWRGAGKEVGALNTAESWRVHQALGLVCGREWVSGWSLGLGLSATRQRSRFLYNEHRDGSTQTTVDTTWTATPMGIQTVYTWNIVESTVQEPASDKKYSATNSYAAFRIAPEVGYTKDLGRWTVGARAGATLSFPLGRKGNTLSSSNALSEGATGAPTTVIPLTDKSLDDRFSPTLGAFAGVDFRYRLFEHWSIGVLPTYALSITGPESGTPRQDLAHFGTALRLLYHWPNKPAKR